MACTIDKLVTENAELTDQLNAPQRQAGRGGGVRQGSNGAAGPLPPGPQTELPGAARVWMPSPTGTPVQHVTRLFNSHSNELHQVGLCAGARHNPQLPSGDDHLMCRSLQAACR